MTVVQGVLDRAFKRSEEQLKVALERRCAEVIALPSSCE